MKQIECEWKETSDAEMRSMITAGRSAIEQRMLGVLIRPRALTPEDEAELDALSKLADEYNKLMDEANVKTKLLCTG